MDEYSLFREKIENRADQVKAQLTTEVDEFQKGLLAELESFKQSMILQAIANLNKQNSDLRAELVKAGVLPGEDDLDG